MLVLIRENDAQVRAEPHAYIQQLCSANENLKILDPVLGDEKLITCVAAEIAKLQVLPGAIGPPPKRGPSLRENAP